ncbi:hypothetical protein T4C_4680 [Trichinella pseudospiralis]|uniref:Uncharacterized protein n=1 Tax=Trichinella pseudospiralis TaxID=6337 RepID=A0A0V1JMZ9_TRIPS|nr:hypothetical protein T4D_7577 [Trichinella pseudospiralis]KRZ36356.1 hypothetical protein T4C_4680 [Trichinella pseudospiralis]
MPMTGFRAIQFSFKLHHRQPDVEKCTVVDWAGCELFFSFLSLSLMFFIFLSSSTEELEILFRQLITTTILVSMSVAPVPVNENHAILFSPTTN